MSANNFRWTARLAAIIGMSACLSACGDGENKSPQLLSGKKQLSAEEQRIQKLLQVKVWDEAAGKTVDKTVFDLISILGIYSGYRNDVSVGANGVSYSDMCIKSDSAGEPGVYLSVAVLLNKVARSMVPITLYKSNDPTKIQYRIPAQDQTSRVGLYYAARRNAINAMGAAFAKIQDTTRSLTTTCNDDGQIQGSQFGEIIGLAYDLFIDSTNGAIESSVIAGDTLRSRAPSEQEGRVWNYSAPEFSRSAAAQLVTGRGGISFDANYDPFCASEPLVPTQLRALSLIRTAAPNPVDVLSSTVSTGSLIGGPTAATDPGAAPTGGTLIQRLSVNLPGSGVSATDTDLPQLVNISLSDFAAARNYAARELVSLGRSLTKISNPGASGIYARYVGTATDGKPLPPIAYSALARASNWGVSNAYPTISDPGNAAPNLYLETMGHSTDPGLDEFNSAVLVSLKSLLPTVNSRIAAVATSNATLGTKLSNELKAPLMALLDRINGQAWGAVDMHYLNQSALSITLDTRVKGFFQFIRGFDGLRCLLEGQVEGATCQIADYTLQVEDKGYSNTDPNSLFGTTHTYLHSFATPSQFPYGPIFIVDGDNGNKVVFGVNWQRGPDGPGQKGGATVVFEDSTKRLNDLLAMDAGWCGQTGHDCLGDNVSDKLPLENELSQDSLDVESSWKRYLELAKQASSEAELRGKEYLEAGLEVERRKEEVWKDRDTRARQAVEQLQQICGTSMDPRKLLDYVNGGSLTAPTSSTCSPTSSCGSSDYQCLAGQCVVDFTALAQRLGGKDPELGRLAQCVSANVVPLTTTGDKPLCAWVNSDNSNAICQGATATMPCPVFAKDANATTPTTGCATLSHPSGTDWRLIPESATLKYFSTSASSGSPPTTEAIQQVCTDIRAIRASLGGSKIHGTGTVITAAERQSKLENLIQSGLFRPDVFTDRTNGWRVEVLPFSNIRISVRGKELWSTGRVGLDANSGSQNWPCGPKQSPPDCESGKASGIMCDYAGYPNVASGASGCDDPWARGDFVLRLHRAAFMMTVGRQRDSQGTFEMSTLPDCRYRNPEARPCEGAETLIYRNGKSPVRQRDCGANGERIYTINDTAESNLQFWWGSEPFPPYSNCNDAIPNSNNVLIPVAQWTSDGNSRGHMVLKSGVWTKIITRRARWTTDTGLFNGLSSANDVAGDISDLKGMALKALKGDENAPIIETMASGESYGASPSNPTNPIWNLENGNGWSYWNYGGKSRADAASVLDAMELYCQAQVDVGLACVPGMAPPSISSSADLPQVSKYLQCIGDGITATAGRTILAKVPAMAMDALSKAGSVGAFPAVGGEYGTEVSELRAALVELSDVGPAIASEIRQMGFDVEMIASAMRLNKLKSDIAGAKFLAGSLAAISACQSGITGIVSAIVSCTNSIAQIDALESIRDLEDDAAKEAGIHDLAQFKSQLEARSRTLADYANRYSAAVERINAKLAKLESLRMNAQRHAAEAIYAASYAAPNSQAIDNTLAWKYQEARRRYEESTKVARKLAIVARRAIEQRLAIRLENLKDPLPLVDAPSTWVQEICQAEGIGFDEIAATQSDSASTDAADGYKHFMGTFVTDYVTRLERTVESYRMAFPFQDGVDEAIVSVRNDLLKARASCNLTSPNVIPNSRRLDQLTGTAEAGSGWKVLGCSSSANPDSYAGCIEAVPGFSYSAPKGETVQFTSLDFDLSKCASVGCSSSTSPKLATSVDLSPGLYNLTYFYSPVVGSTCVLAPKLVSSSGQEVAFADAGNKINYLDVDPAVWRQVQRIKIDNFDTYTLQFVEQSGGACTNAAAGYRRAYLGDVMLVSQSSASWNSLEVPDYLPTDTSGSTTFLACQDSAGTNFRLAKWSERKCVRLCDDGYADSCDNASGRLECFRELRFSLDEQRIENSEFFQGAGFAKGNYNYRTEEIGVNFVGTGIKDCTQSSTPDSCYSNGNIQYTIEHLGPFFVRNHMGNDIESKIFNGRIEHARGLATERYLTNPISSTDRTLLQPYMRDEFQGRPLSGEYVLRLWESPDVNFDKIEDVQFFLRYRYWTRQN
jgi:hypothetical protein